MKFLTQLITTITLSLASVIIMAAEFAISPMMIELDSSPGINEKFSFQIHGKKAGIARIFMSDLQQEASGHMSFSEFKDTKSNNLVSWITLEKNSVKVKQDETVTIDGVINIPRRTTGSHVAAIMVEEEKTGESSGINLNVRYAIIIAVNIDGKKSRISTAYEGLTIEEQNGNYFVSAWFSNNSIIDSKLQSVAYIRSADRKLLEKVELKTKSAWQRNDKLSRVFPKAKVKVYGIIKSDIPNGALELSARNRFGGRMQPLKKATVNFKTTKILATKEDSSKSDSILPDTIALKVKSNQGFAAITIKNPLENEVVIELPESGVRDGIDFTFTPSTFTLQPKQSQMVIIRQRFLNSDVKASEFNAKLIKNNKEELIQIKTLI
ncbi:MAG: hypothetical protein K6L73_14060 [Cellvibrionaceae bacterium]